MPFKVNDDNCKYLRILKYIYTFLRSSTLGDFKDAEVNLHTNNLTRLEESVFGQIQQQMASGKGLIYTGNSKL